MEKELINKMLKAGIDAQTVLSLILDDDTPAETPEAAAGTGAEGAADPAPADAAPEAQAAPAQNDAILAAINKLTGAIQASNIINLGKDTPPALTVDDVMKKLIGSEAPAGKE